MPQIRVLYWNIQNLGSANTYREFQYPRMVFIARLVAMADADVVCIQELKADAIGVSCLAQLQEELNAREAALGRRAHWYYDYIQGGLNPGDGTPPPVTKPFNAIGDLIWDGGHHEGYAIFWRQNLAKFSVIAAPRIQPPTAMVDSPNSQSSGTFCQGAAGVMPVGGMPVPAGGIDVPNVLNPYMVSAGTVIPPAPALANDTAYAAGTALPANTVIGPNGVWLSAQTSNVNPIVIPGGYQLGADTFTLPAAQTVVVPKQVASLVLFGRDTTSLLTNRPTLSVYDISAAAANFAAGGATPWNWLEFTRSNKGVAERVLSRRPAYFTIDVNAGGGAAARLVPIVVYHAPATGNAAISGMQRSAYSQPLYQAYDWTLNAGNGDWIDCNNALIGGDFNVVNADGDRYAYNAFTDAFGNAGQFGGGAGATQLVTYPNALNYDPTDARNKSIVAINQGFNGQGPAIYSANFTAFRTRSIDNVFYRGLANVAVVYGGVADLLTMVSGGNGVPAVSAAALQAFLNLPLMLHLRYGPNYPNPPDLNSRFSTLNDLIGGRFGTTIPFLNDTVARRAAEFVRLFVSDHLPVGIQFRM